MPDEVRECYARHIGLGTHPSITEYPQLLQVIAARFSRVYLVIDALDECNDRGGTWSGLIKEIRKLPPNLHLLCTSRPVGDIEQLFSGSPCQEIRASKLDVEMYLLEYIEKDARLKKHVLADPSLLDEITGSIVAKVDGMLSCQKNPHCVRRLIDFKVSSCPVAHRIRGYEA